MIRLEHITKRYGSHTVLSDLSMDIPDSGITCLRGASGSGKTTLLRLILGLEQPDEGTISGVPDQIACVFQEDRLLPWRTAAENVAWVAHDAAGHLLPRAERDRIAREYLSRLGIGEAADLRPDQLSGGMRRRVAIARAAASGGQLLILDEPFKGLDPAARESAMEFLRRHFSGIPALYVTHDEAEAAAFSDTQRTLPAPETV